MRPNTNSTFALLNDPRWVREHYERQGMSMSAIAQLVGCSAPTVRNALDRHAIAVRPKGRHPQLADAGWLREHYIERNLNQSAIGRIVGCAPSVVRSALIRHSIDRRNPVVWEVDSQWLRQQHHNLRRDVSDIADAAGVSRSTIRMALERHGIEPVRWMWDLDETWLREQFETRQRTMLSVVRETGLDHTIIDRICASYDIERPRRRTTESTRAPIIPTTTQRQLERADLGERATQPPHRPFRSAWRPTQSGEVIDRRA